MGNFRRYLWAAFCARPLGMPIPPNWVGVAAFGILGLLNPGFWLIGAGVEVAYLLACANHPRFRAIVDAKARLKGDGDAEKRLAVLLGKLSSPERVRFGYLDQRCRRLVSDANAGSERALAEAQAESLAGLRWAYLQLLVMRGAVRRVVDGARESGQNAVSMLGEVETIAERLREESLSSALRESLSAQRDVLRRRLEIQNDARAKLEHVESELVRIENHVELVREQTLMSGNPGSAGQRIDEAAGSLESTTKWIKEQSELGDTVFGLLSEPPPVIAERESSE